MNLDSEELRIIFLTAVCESTPAVIENLFAMGDADKWADAWNVRAIWLCDFAGAILRSNPRIIFLSQALRHGVALTAWKRAIERRRSVRAAAEAADTRRKTALKDGATEKRRAEAHCRWLALWLFYDMNCPTPESPRPNASTTNPWSAAAAALWPARLNWTCRLEKAGREKINSKRRR